MKICTVFLCLLALPGIAQSDQESEYLEFFLSYENSTATELSAEEENELLSHVYDLFLSPDVKIDLLSCGVSFSSLEVMAQRTAYFERLRREYELTDSTTSISVVTSRFEDEPRADVRIRFIDPLLRKKPLRPEVKYTHVDGWRVHCFQDQLPFMKQTRISVVSRPEELERLNLLTCDESGQRLEVLALASINMVRDTILQHPIKFHIPLHGMEATGCMEYLLLAGDSHTFLSGNGKASMKREDGLTIWKIDAVRSGTFVIARPAKEQFSATFTAPDGYAILSGKAVCSSPYMFNFAEISLNQLTATFKSLPDPENVFCEFVLSDVHGNQLTTPKMSAADLMHESLLGYFKRNENILPVDGFDEK